MKTSYLTFAPFGTKCSRNKNLQVGDERKWKHVRYQWLKHSYTRHCSWTTECVLEIFLAIPGNRVKTLEKQAWHLTWRDKWGRCRVRKRTTPLGEYSGVAFLPFQSRFAEWRLCRSIKMSRFGWRNRLRLWRRWLRGPTYTVAQNDDDGGWRGLGSARLERRCHVVQSTLPGAPSPKTSKSEILSAFTSWSLVDRCHFHAFFLSFIFRLIISN